MVSKKKKKDKKYTHDTSKKKDNNHIANKPSHSRPCAFDHVTNSHHIPRVSVVGCCTQGLPNRW
jgi:hypothetical protein